MRHIPELLGAPDCWLAPVTALLPEETVIEPVAEVAAELAPPEVAVDPDDEPEPDAAPELVDEHPADCGRETPALWVEY